MGLEKNNEQHYREVVDKFVDPSTNYALTTRDYVIRPVCNRESGPITLVLPAVAEAKGRFYSIIVREADLTNTVTVTHRLDSECWLADIVLNNPCDRLLLYSDGLAWHVLSGLPGKWPGLATTIPPHTMVPTTTEAPQ